MEKNLSRPETISRFKKERFLLAMTEDKFRDEVIRPLFLRQGLKDGRDVCGPMEKGKDAIFFATDKLGIEDMYVVQTKKGSLNMSRKVTENVVEAITQLKTALETTVPLPAKHKKKLPSKAFLCASGRINEHAREHIVERVGDPRIVILDSDDLIPKIDEFFPELWLGIDAEIFPYLRAIRRMVESAGDDAAYSDIVPDGSVLDAATDAMFVQLRLHRSTIKHKKGLSRSADGRTPAWSGEHEPVIHFEEFPVNAVLARRERLVLILGDAGAGKSTSLKRLAYVLAERGLEAPKSFRVPILIRATEVLARVGEPLVELLISSTQRLVSTEKAAFTNDDLVKGNVVVLVDALDELASDEARKKVVETVHTFSNLFSKCQIIVTSRDYSFIRNLDCLAHFAHFTLSPIDHKQASQIIKRFEKRKNLSIEKGKEILRRIQEVHGMELNPLLVTVFAATSDYSRRDIPANITELFKKFTEMMLGRWDASKGIGQQYHAPLKDFLLQRIAYEMHRRNKTSIPKTEFETTVQTELSSRGHVADIPQLLDELLNRSGLLRVIGDEVEFRHHLLQEFFAGRGIPNKQLLGNYVGLEWWQRAVVFYFGQNPEDAEAFELALNALVGATSKEISTAAMTIGLALQACYLLQIEARLRVYPWVVESLARSETAMIQAIDPQERFPIADFIGYYITGRDAVACGVLNDKFDEIQERLMKPELKEDEISLRKFWLIVGLMEIGSIEKAKEQLTTFRPTDPRMLLAISLGCAFIEHVRIGDKTEKRGAQEIARKLTPVVTAMLPQFFKEFKTHLLEIRQGKMHEIEMPTDVEAKTEPPTLG
jgi:hypothetical protein